MEKFSYKGLDNDTGKTVRGEVTANNEKELLVSLEKMGITLISSKLEQQKPSLLAFLDKIKTKDLITFFNHLDQLEKAGVSIVDALDDIKNSDTYSPKIKTMVQDVHESVINGSLFSDALKNHPKVFTEVFIGLIANGEKTGNLSQSFNNIVEHLKWSEDIKKKTAKAVRYPAFSLFMMFIVMMVMTNVVVPKVTGFLQQQKLELPGMTKALISFSSFMQSYALIILLMIPTTIIVYKLLRKIPEFALQADRIKLYIPICGSLITKMDASRFCNFFSTTFESGIGVLECIDSTKQVISNRAIRESIDLIKQKVSEGKSLADSIKASGKFTGLVIRMFKVGEDSGNMAQALDNIKFFYDQEINDSIDKMVGMIQPTLVLVMGGMMMWITGAIFGPIYDSFSRL